jgi:transcriptional regulator with XRE-family HTH domain
MSDHAKYFGLGAKRFWDALPEERRNRIEADYQKEKAEYLNLQTLRESLALTQNDVAEILNVRQVSVSSFENRQDMKLSTLCDYVDALGCKVRILIDIPGRDSIVFDPLILKAPKTKKSATSKKARTKHIEPEQ